MDSQMFLQARAKELENVYNDIPTVVQSLIAQNEYGSKINIFDLYVRNASVVGSDGTLYTDIYSVNKDYPEVQETKTIRFSCQGGRLSGKTTFLKSIFCSLALKKKPDITRWWYLSYGITPDMYPFYLKATEINKMEWSDFWDVIKISICKSVIMRNATENELKKLEDELNSILASGKLLLLIDDADDLKTESMVKLREFLRVHSDCHAILTYSYDPIMLMDIGMKLKLPKLDVETEVLLKYSEHLCDALGCGGEYRSCEKYMMENASIGAYAKYYVHTPIDLIYLILSTGIVNKSSILFKTYGENVKLNLNSILDGMIHIRKEHISEDCLDFFSERAYISMMNHLTSDEPSEDPLDEFSMPQTVCCSDNPDELNRIMRQRERHWNYFLEAQDAGIAGIHKNDNGITVSKKFVFTNQQFQAWLVARYVAYEQELSELPEAIVKLYPADFIVDFWACLFAQEQRVFLRLFKRMMDSLSEDELRSRILTIYGLLWRIGWNEIPYFHGEIANLLLGSYFNYGEESEKKGIMEYDYWRSGCLFYENVLAELFRVATHIEDAWIEKILYAYRKSHHSAFDRIFSVLLQSPLCSRERKKDICKYRLENGVTPMSDVPVFSTLHKDTLLLVNELMKEIELETDVDYKDFSGMYGDLLFVLHGSNGDAAEILHELLNEAKYAWNIRTVMYLVRWFDIYREVLPKIALEIMSELPGLIESSEAKSYEEFLIYALSRIEKTPEVVQRIQLLQNAYLKQLMNVPSDYTHVTRMLVELGTSPAAFSEQNVEVIKERYLTDKQNRFELAKLLLLAGAEDFLVENPVPILQMRQDFKVNHNHAEWWCDILTVVTRQIEEKYSGHDGYDNVEIVELENAKEYMIATRKEVLGRDYLLLINEDNPTDFCIRRIIRKGNEENLEKLSNENEFDVVLPALLTDSISKYGGMGVVGKEDILAVGSEQYAWDSFVSAYERIMNLECFQIENGILTKFHDTDEEIVVLPKCVKIIGEEAFRGCSRLQGVIFQEGLLEIKKNAFADCTALVSVEFVDSINKIESGAFINTALSEAVLHSPCPVETSVTDRGKNMFLTVGLELPIESAGTLCGNVTADMHWIRWIHKENDQIAGNTQNIILCFPPECRIYTICLTTDDICSIPPLVPPLHLHEK